MPLWRPLPTTPPWQPQPLRRRAQPSSDATVALGAVTLAFAPQSVTVTGGATVALGAATLGLAPQSVTVFPPNVTQRALMLMGVGS